MSKCLIIYRGPLQRSRLSLIISSYCEAFHDVHFIWLVPCPKYFQKSIFFKFINQFDLTEIDSIDASINRFISAYKYLNKKVKKEDYSRLVLVGTTSILFLPFKSDIPRDFFINGIPEERCFHNSNLYNRIHVLLIWKSISFHRVDRVFSVSENMSKYLQSKIKAKSFFSIPSGIYHNQGEEKFRAGTKMVYSGSGAPWQWLSHLSQVWEEIQMIDSSIEFLVISRDSRAKILAQGLTPGSVTFVNATNGEEVFEFLQEGKLGFLIREDHLVNQVCYPIKFGEYLAAGLHVVVSDFDWACSQFVKENGGGILVFNENLKNEAFEIINFFYSLDFKDKNIAHELSGSLSRENSKKKLVAILDGD